MKKRYDKDEWYPVWEFDDTGRWVAEVSEEFVARVEACFKEFDAIQEEFKKLEGEDA